MARWDMLVESGTGDASQSESSRAADAVDATMLRGFAWRWVAGASAMDAAVL